MSTLKLGGLLLLVAALPSLAWAQAGKYSAAIVLPEIQMRSGASWQFPPTGKLRKGEQVIVHHEDGGWVAIVAPPGALSWVNHRFLGEFDPNGNGKQNALVMADNVEVRVGSENNSPLAVAQVKLPRGTWVEVNGPKQRDENSTWYPITPPEGEYRWLPKEALGAPAALTPPPVFVKSNNPSVFETAAYDKNSSSNPKTFVSAAPPQWDKAEQAEHSGDYTTAEKLYTLIYQSLRQQNAEAEQLLVCYNRIIKCQDRLRLDATTSRPSLTPPPLADGAKPPATLQSPSGSNASTVGLAWPADARTANTGAQRWTGVGSLRRAGFNIDGKQAYALESDRGQVLYYVTAGSGVGLDAFVNRAVDLLGAVQVRGDIRGGQYMVVAQVNAMK